ncbi:MAG: Crp/Fnr family transcriptional regulator [Rhizomicrobium sp.]
MPPFAMSLEKNPWFAALPPALKAALVARSRMLEVAQGQWVYGAGDALDGLYAVLRGSIHLMVGTVAEEDILMDIVSAGQVFGQPSQFGGGPRLVTALAGEDALLLHVPDHTLREIARDHPDVWRSFTTLLYLQLAHALRLAVNMIRLAPKARVAARLLFLCGEREGALLRVTQSQLAEMTGLSRKTVNGHLANLGKRGAIGLSYSGIAIADVAALRRAAAG